MSYQLIFPKINWCEFLLILDYLSPREKYLCGCTSKSAFVHIVIRGKNIASSKTLNCATLLPSFCRRERVLLLSYPRCGNSHLRLLLERETGVITGSDSRSNRNLAARLIRSGFKGEGIVDSSVWIVKSHFPERMGYVQVLPVKLTIIV